MMSPAEAQMCRPLPGHTIDVLDRSLDWHSGAVRLHYALDGHRLTETLQLPEWPPALGPLSEVRRQAVDAALDLLHWVAALSYWKASCAKQWRFSGRRPDAWQANWLNDLLRQGLAEFAWHNALDVDGFAVIARAPESPEQAAVAPDSGLDTGFHLLPLGGGKDSLVAWQRLQGRVERCVTVQVGEAARIAAVAEALGGEHWVVRRQLDPQLAVFNAAGAFNGHVPITAINAAIMVLVALVHGAGRVVFANERSADEATLHDQQGRPVNHQYAKSFAFECAMDAWVRHYIDPELRVFSLLRQERELAICKAFAELTSLHAQFSSCNRNFHLAGPRTQRWCGECAKCHFVFLALALFMSPDALEAIFGDNLLARSDQTEGFLALLALDARKPFECVGEAQEARAAVRALAKHPEWADLPVVRALNAQLGDVAVPSIAELCEPSGEHLIPEALQHASG
jgi:hypothetical protein